MPRSSRGESRVHCVRRRVLLAAIFLAVAFSVMGQDCGTPSVGVPSYVPDANGNGTLSVTYSFPTASSGNYVQIWIDGGIHTTLSSPAQTGTWTMPLSSSCWATGSHAVGALAVSCGRWWEPQYKAASQIEVTVNTTPAVSGLVYDADSSGRGTLSVDYTFPNTASPSDRWLQLWIDGAQGSPITMSQQSGTFSTALDTTCWPTGPHTIEVLGVACNQWQDPLFKDLESHPLSVDTTPRIVDFTAALDAAGNCQLNAQYEFPNTASSGDRWLQLWTNGSPGSPIPLAEPSGTWSHSFPAACMTGPLVVELLGVACNETSDPRYKTLVSQTVTIPNAHVVDVATRRLSASRARAIVSYEAPEGASNRLVKLEVLPWFDENGNLVPGSTIGEYTTATAAGTLSIDFDTPTATHQFFVKATLSTCRGQQSDEAAVECCECLEAPSCTNDPVAFIDGNMRYSDADPLPPMLSGTLRRTYDSNHQARGAFGRGWTSAFDSRLSTTISGGTELAYFTGTSNEAAIFRKTGGTFVQQWPSGVRAVGTLQLDAASGLYLHRAAGARTVSLFRASDGRFAGWRELGTGREARITYNASGLPLAVTDSWTELTWTITTDAAKRRVSSIVVEGRPDLSWNYQYDANDNLERVLGPGGTAWRVYEYVNNRMTAARDAAGFLIESHAYDASGRAIDSTGPGDEIASLVYDLPGPQSSDTITRVTTRAGQVSDYLLRPQGSGFRTVKVIGGCTSCGSGDAVYAYDERGRVTRKQQADGYITVTSFSGDRVESTSGPYRPAGCDPESSATRCRLDETTIDTTVLEPAPQWTSSTYLYGDAVWPERPTEIRTESVAAPDQWRREQFVYDAQSGDTLVHRIIGWTGQPLREETRTTTTAYYDGVEGASFDPGGSFQSAWLALPQPRHLRKTVDGPRSDVADVTQFVYFPIDPAVPAARRGRLAAIRNAAGHVTRYESYDEFGNGTRVVDPNGVATEQTFDAVGRPLTTTIKGIAGCDTAADPLCATDLAVSRTYMSTLGPLQSEQSAGGNVTAYGYDARGRLQTLSRGPVLTDLRERIETSYDTATGKKSLERLLAFEGGQWVEKKRESFAYDTDSRLQTVTHADGASMHYAYDSAGRLSGVRDENHGAANTLYAYDSAGRLTEIRQTLSGAPSGQVVTTYSYDLHGNLTSVTDPNGNVTSYLYDDFGQLLSQTSPVTGTTTYVYDIAGQLTSVTDANAATTTRTYDVLGRVTAAHSTRDGRNEELVSWTWDDPAAGRHAIGRIASMTDPAGATAYHYERRGLLRREERTATGAPALTTSFTYTHDGERSTLTYPSGRTVTYGHDYAGRPRSASIPGQILISSVTYLPFGPASLIVYGNGTTQTMPHDTRYRITQNRLSTAAGTIADYGYSWD
ncbi:MAG TPA: DUF6531 domain-containing protein, partial [Thermoanaerobaculia bacterium]|nr:DUF6531 domain-containing protein [Thermoanaerobaculia bacterium]